MKKENYIVLFFSLSIVLGFSLVIFFNGCWGGCISTDINSGALIIEDKRNQKHKTTVTLEKISDEPYNQTVLDYTSWRVHQKNNNTDWLKTHKKTKKNLPTHIDPIWTKNTTYTKTKNHKTIDNNFIENPGIYYIEIHTQPKKTKAYSINIYTGSNGLGGGYIKIELTEKNNISINRVVDN